MRKLKLQIQLSVDGYIADRNGSMDSMVWDWDDELKQYVGDITKPVDCIILGRKLAEGFIPYWDNVASDPQNPEYSSGKKYMDTPKVVFTKTLKKSEWSNTVLAKGDLADHINALKKQHGGDIIVYGGSELVSSLIKNGLIDEFHLFVNPSVFGSGLPIFNELESTQQLKLVQSKSFSCGIVLLNYELKRD